MKHKTEYTSIMALAARSAMPILLPLWAVGMLLQVGLFLWNQDIGRIDLIMEESRISLVFSIMLILTMEVLSILGRDKSGQLGYTLSRLSVSQRKIHCIWAGCYALCFFLLWAMELVLMVGLSQWFVMQNDGGSQAIFLSFYSNDFLHALLPLDEWSIWLRNIVMMCYMGVTASYLSYVSRRSGRGVWATVILYILVMNFPIALGGLASSVIDITVMAVVMVVMYIIVVNENVYDEEKYEAEYKLNYEVDNEN